MLQEDFPFFVKLIDPPNIFSLHLRLVEEGSVVKDLRNVQMMLSEGFEYTEDSILKFLMVYLIEFRVFAEDIPNPVSLILNLLLSWDLSSFQSFLESLWDICFENLSIDLSIGLPQSTSFIFKLLLNENIFFFRLVGLVFILIIIFSKDLPS